MAEQLPGPETPGFLAALKSPEFWAYVWAMIIGLLWGLREVHGKWVAGNKADQLHQAVAEDIDALTHKIDGLVKDVRRLDRDVAFVKGKLSE